MRVHGFDFLRGLCAIMVAAYHMLYWSDTAYLYSWGLFGVYIFFALSGASMVIAYRDRFASGFPASQFLAYRFLRLAPLYVLVLVVGMRTADPPRLLLNAALLFGLGSPGATSGVTGGWSIGVEVAYYLMFPLLLSVSQSKGRWWVGALLVVGQLAFVQWALDGKTLLQAWATYTQPLAFIAYFYLGCLIGGAVLDGMKQNRGLLFAAAFGLILAGSGASAQDTLKGWHGVGLFALVMLTVWASAGMKVPGRLADFLGETSYGTYLLHPFAYYSVLKLGLPLFAAIPLALALSIGTAWVSYRYFEAPAQRWAKRRIA